MILNAECDLSVCVVSTKQQMEKMQKTLVCCLPDSNTKHKPMTLNQIPLLLLSSIHFVIFCENIDWHISGSVQ